MPCMKGLALRLLGNMKLHISNYGLPRYARNDETLHGINDEMPSLRGAKRRSNPYFSSPVTITNTYLFLN